MERGVRESDKWRGEERTDKVIQKGYIRRRRGQDELHKHCAVANVPTPPLTSWNTTCSTS